MSEMKYVVAKVEGGEEQIFIFPKAIDHDAFAEVLSYIKTGGRNWKREYRSPISAGFTDGAKCYGRSETLNLSSRPSDTSLLGRASLADAQAEIARLRGALTAAANYIDTLGGVSTSYRQL